MEKISIIAALSLLCAGSALADGVKTYNIRGYFAHAYDTGSEANDELCADIPGPPRFGTALSDPADRDEDYVHIRPGTHGEVNLASSMHCWRDAVAKIIVPKIN